MNGFPQSAVCRRPYDARMTVLEIAHITTKPGSEDAFVAAYREGRNLLTDLAECHSVTMTRGIESPSDFRLLVVWDSVEAHLEKFRNDEERYGQWRSLIGPHFAAPPVVEHYADVDAG